MRHIDRVVLIEHTEKSEFAEAVASKLQRINDSEGSILSVQYQCDNGVYSCMIHYATHET